MDRTMPPFNMEPDPAFEIEVEDFRIPVLELPREFIPPPVRDRKIRIYALAGYHTPTGNIKYIPASYMLKRASETGLCQKGQTVVEATSGNFGDSLAFCARRYGVKVAAIVSDKPCLILFCTLRPYARPTEPIRDRSRSCARFEPWPLCSQSSVAA